MKPVKKKQAKWKEAAWMACLPKRISEKIKVVDECWIWQGAKNNQGYPQLSWNKKTELVHRIVFQLTTNNLAPDLQLCHKCDTPLCVNPNHLFQGTQKDNERDKINKLRHRFGENHQNAKLSNKDVESIFGRYRRGEATLTAMAIEYGVNRTHLSHIVTGRKRRLG